MRRKKSKAEERLAEFKRARQAVTVARNHFSWAESAPQIERSIVELITAEARLRAAIQALKETKSA